MPIERGNSVFVIDLTYRVPLSAIDARIEPHIEFLKRHYARGTFIASGPKIPRDGGVILARATSRADIERIITEDPFHADGLAEYRITEFLARMTEDRA